MAGNRRVQSQTPCTRITGGRVDRSLLSQWSRAGIKTTAATESRR